MGNGLIGNATLAAAMKTNVITHLGNVGRAKAAYFATVVDRRDRGRLPPGGDMRKGRVRAALIGVSLSGLCAVAACGSSSGGGQTTSSNSFHPSGSMAGQAPASTGSGAGQVVMPAFGKNVHIDLTSWHPANPSQAQAVLVDKDYELAFLYAEYTGGQDSSWANYVSSAMQTEVQATLSKPDVTSESFTGKIRIFDMSVVADPTVPGRLDVSGCFDNAQSSNINRQTGQVIPDTGSPDQHYYRYTDQLSRNGSGQWQVTSDLPAIYYPRAKECKP